MAEFVTQLRRLKAWSGLTYRQLERRAAERGDVLPPSTVATALKRESLPRTELVRALVTACGGDEDTVERWVAARRRLAAGEEMAPAAVRQVSSSAEGTAGNDPRHGRRRISRWLRAGRRGAARLAPILATLLLLSASSPPGPGDPAPPSNRPEQPRLPTPVAWWRFEETGGPTAFDSSGHNAHAVIGGDVTRTTVPGGHALEFDGGGHATARGPVIRTDTAFTVAAWVRLDAPGQSGTVISEHHGTRDPDVILLDYDAEHTDWAFMFPERHKGWAMGDETVFSGLRPASRTWVHLAAVFAPAAHRVCLYVAGNLEACRTRATITRADGPLDIGRALVKGEPTDGWHGAIDDVRVFATALTSAQIEEVAAQRF